MASSSNPWTTGTNLNKATAVLINEHERFQLHHIDDAGVAGPNARNALQVVSEALDIQSQQEHEKQVISSSAEEVIVNPAEVEHQLKTIVASDSDVSNGFVKCGRSLPYVFEATETGVRKRSSKILPVCAVCGKRFVCVTTMKRHLVTHTGEKPFSCKVCGKQYTQKGNLRVHERTHRNDRPFECNICHQKFYRKEPMQKHQWRQHGIVHFKTRPPTNNNGNVTVTAATAATTANTNELSNESSTSNPHHQQPILPTSTRTLEPPKPLIPLRPAKPTSYTALVDSLRAGSRENSPYRSMLDPGNAPTAVLESSPIQLTSLPPPTAHQQTPLEVPKFEPRDQQEVAVDLKTTPTTISSCSSPSTTDSSSNFAYSSILNEGAGTSIMPNNHLLIVPPTTSATEQSTAIDQPIKLKMKMAYARAAHEHEQLQREQEASTVVIKNEVPHNLDNDLNEMKIGPNEMVECQCKTCGNTFSVVDPYNFRCNNCNVKYTSLPTHMIADPLQCIGCCAVFPHKPALKAHQTVVDKERPFRCCKCGYGFRQKAHLQKHQWRIHRRKLEPDPQMKEAEAFFEVMKSQQQQQIKKPSSMDNNVATITMQDIINKSVEKSIGEGPRSLMKTSSKYYSEVLGLEYEPKSSEGSSEDDDTNQPLDLSPAKKSSAAESVATRVITFSSNPNSRETNPLLNQPPLPSTSTPNQLEYNPAWKKQKTSNLHSLPPISGLQKPMSLVVTPTTLSPHQQIQQNNQNYKHSSWINNDKPLNLVPVQQKEPKHFRSHLELLKSSNTRTV